MSSNNKKLIAVIGATEQQGGGVVRPNCVRKQNSRQATDQVFDVDTTEFPGSDALNANIHSMRTTPARSTETATR